MFNVIYIQFNFLKFFFILELMYVHLCCWRQFGWTQSRDLWPSLLRPHCCPLLLDRAWSNFPCCCDSRHIAAGGVTVCDLPTKNNTAPLSDFRTHKLVVVLVYVVGDDQTNLPILGQLTASADSSRVWNSAENWREWIKSREKASYSHAGSILSAAS